RNIVEIDLFADDRRIAAETFLPVSMTQNSNCYSAGFVVVIRQHMTNRRMPAELREVITRHSLAACYIRLTISSDVQSDTSKCEDVRHRALLLAQALVSLVCE